MFSIKKKRLVDSGCWKNGGKEIPLAQNIYEALDGAEDDVEEEMDRSEELEDNGR